MTFFACATHPKHHCAVTTDKVSVVATHKSLWLIVQNSFDSNAGGDTQRNGLFQYACSTTVSATFRDIYHF
jgi:hypothetical protein